MIQAAWNRRVRRALASRPGEALSPLLAALLRVDHLGARRAPRHPFLVVTSIDTEAGFVRDDGSRVWSDAQPRALQGFTAGIPVALDLAKELDQRFSFLLSTQCFLRAPRRDPSVRGVLERLLDEGHELGLHLHPRTDEALHAALGRRLAHASAHFYGEDEQVQMLETGRGLIGAELGRDVAEGIGSFRWGNWALASSSVRALERAGFDVDSTAIPGMSGHLDDDRRYDWSRLDTAYPFRLSRADHQDSATHDSEVLELPVPTFRCLRRGLADPAWGSFLKVVLGHYHRNADRSRAPFVFVVCTHSCELIREDGRPSATPGVLREFGEFASGLEGVEFETLRGAARRVRALETCES